ncbi:CoA transferase [Rhodobacterales bacterium 52_120_T64]|mgnify:CR=1 FL=1|nr:CoA transferase [Rhodobacterales bacterium 52_120_T64]
MEQPLKGIRIVELGHVIAGPLAATLLADFGAEVTKIENPRGGDMMRDLGPRAKDDGLGVWWKTLARNKSILALDWKTPEGRKILRKLVEDSDVLVENFRPGVLERAGIGPDVLHEWNPALIILRISGYGQDGPMVKTPAFGRAAEAMSGLAHLTGYTDGPPMHPGFPAADSTTGLMGAFGIMLALHAREKDDGKGQVIDLAVFEGLMRLIDYHVPVATGTDLSPKRNGLRQPMDFAPGGMFCTNDGIWVTVSAGSAETARRLLRASGGDAFADDPRFATMAGISANMGEVFEALKTFIGARDFATVQAEFEKNDAVAAKVLSVEDILEHPQIAHRGDIVTVPDEQTKVVAPVPQLSKTPGKVRWLGRPEGANSREILQELGLTTDEVDALVASGVVGLAKPTGGRS